MKKLLFMLFLVFGSIGAFAQVRAKVVVGNDHPVQHRHYEQRRHYVRHRYVRHRRHYNRPGTHVVLKANL